MLIVRFGSAIPRVRHSLTLTLTLRGPLEWRTPAAWWTVTNRSAGETASVVFEEFGSGATFDVNRSVNALV